METLYGVFWVYLNFETNVPFLFSFSCSSPINETDSKFPNAKHNEMQPIMAISSTIRYLKKTHEFLLAPQGEKFSPPTESSQIFKPHRAKNFHPLNEVNFFKPRRAKIFPKKCTLPFFSKLHLHRIKIPATSFANPPTSQTMSLVTVQMFWGRGDNLEVLQEIRDT